MSRMPLGTVVVLALMDNTLSSAFEDTVFPYDIDLFSFFDRDNSFPSFNLEDSTQSFSSGTSNSGMEFARFIFERSSEEGSEPDFATSGPSVAMTPAVFWPDSISERCDRLSLSDAETTASLLCEILDASVDPSPLSATAQTPEATGYLPSPPITPVCKRTIKREDSLQPDDSTTTTSANTSSLHSITPTRGKYPSPKAHGKTPTMVKLSIRRKLGNAVAKRIDGRGKVKSDIHSLKKHCANPELVAEPAAQGSSDHFTSRSRKNSSIPKRSAKSITKSKARTTNNSLSTTLNPTITKQARKSKNRYRTSVGGKICSAYYPSGRKVVPNTPGERYFKGKPGKCAREDCAGDSKATVTRHCISEYLQKGARGSAIPRHLRLHWCNKCYMRHRADADYYPRLFSMILDQLEYVAADGHGENELFHIEYSSYHDIVDLARAKEFVIGYWKKFANDGKDRRFKVVPIRF